jgi:hypothetical protein
MNEKKNGRIMVNLTSSDKKEFDKICAVYGSKTGGLAAVILEAFILAVNEHGDNVVWPPKFERRTHPNALTPELLKEVGKIIDARNAAAEQERINKKAI